MFKITNIYCDEWAAYVDIPNINFAIPYCYRVDFCSGCLNLDTSEH